MVVGDVVALAIVVIARVDRAITSVSWDVTIIVNVLRASVELFCWSSWVNAIVGSVSAVVIWFVRSLGYTLLWS